MTWKETCTMSERESFINGWLSGCFSVTELCERFGVSRKTGHKWINRFKAEGMAGLADQSRARHTQAQRTPEAVIERIVELKLRYDRWGPVTIHSALHRDNPDGHWPAISTIGEILSAHNLVKTRRPRRKTPPHTQPLAHATGPNEVWSADFKGHFRLGNGHWCYPLTLSDNCSRLLISCRGMPTLDLKASFEVYRQAFRSYGLPKVIRTDNGWPFAMNVLGGLTPLAIWLLKLNIYPERIAPGKPSQNGRHERMHRTLKDHTAKPPKGDMSAQQRAFNHFRNEYNEERPHQSLGLGKCPIDVHVPSPRPYPERIPQIHYPDEFAVRKVKYGGYIKLNGQPIYTTRQLTGEHIGLEPLDHERWQLYFGRLKLGVVDERLGRVIRPA
ncbi:IS481 family transposase [Marinimicrobium sp. ABcell2]|uniref:IS481 family transposase n=1 Tax=Marinimicrobium sp. ABcell2 TaxID=3069751 RepID=UPI0027B4F5FA|nr:IS481 family transposase [Marinimicrobium sp. ABcell2]MDQ2078546.1 IS481 family transposase [Marinimicrobium sp. ABcell2]